MSLLNEKLCQCYDFYFLLPFNLDYVIFRIKFNIEVDGWVGIVVEAGQSMNLWWEHACCLCYLYKKFRSSILISYYFFIVRHSLLSNVLMWISEQQPLRLNPAEVCEVIAAVCSETSSTNTNLMTISSKLSNNSGKPSMDVAVSVLVKLVIDMYVLMHLLAGIIESVLNV